MAATEADVLKFLQSQPTAGNVQSFLHDSVAPMREAQRLKRESQALNHSAVSDFLRMGAQGATLGFGDEIAGIGAAMVPGGKGYTQARDASRERVSALRQEAPGASMMAEMAGGLLAPGMGVKQAMQAPTLLGRVAGSAAVGAGTSGLMAAGEATGSPIDRAKAAIVPALAGAGIGAAIPVAADAIKIAPQMIGSANKRVASALEQTTGLSGDIQPARIAAGRAVQDVRDQFYKPLEKKIGVLGGMAPTPAEQDVLDILNSPDVLRFAPRSVAEKPMHGPWKFKRPWSYEDIQGKGMLMDRLRKAAKTDPGYEGILRDLDAALGNAYPEHAAANQMYAGAASVQRALEDGWKKTFKGAADINRYTANLSPEAADAFRQGQVSQIITRLNKRDKQMVGVLRTWLDAGPETRATLRSLFDSDQKFGQFMNVLQKEDNVAKVRASLANLSKLGAGGILGFTAGRMLFGGHESAP